MAHSLAAPPAAAAATAPVSAAIKSNVTSFRSVSCHNVQVPHQVSDDVGAPNIKTVQRRAVGLVLVGAAASLFNVIDPSPSANAAARRPPPPPAEEKEKRDPNVSGVLAKVLASKKRKEAMKEYVAKLRDKGKPIQE